MPPDEWTTAGTPPGWKDGRPDTGGGGPAGPGSLEAAARLFEEAAAKLDRASAHCHRTAEHFRGREVPRAAAHAWAALGHLREAERAMEAQAREHRLRANV